MKKTNYFNWFISIAFIFFLVLFFISNSKYYDYEASRKKQLTEQQIKVFEEKIAKGEQIDIKKYNIDKTAEYDNFLSRTSLKISNKIGSTFQKGLNYLFKNIEKMVN